MKNLTTLATPVPCPLALSLCRLRRPVWRLARVAAAMAMVFALTSGAFADPLLTSWLTNSSAQYARAYTNTTMRTSGTSVTTWSSQSLPSYADIPFVASSTSWVYVRAADLPSYIIGPWLNPQGVMGQLYPKNQQLLNRFPRTPAVQSGTKTITGTGYSGLYVDGVAVFNFTDGKAWDPTNQTVVSGPHNQPTYYWHRTAPAGEGFNFDYGLGHQNPAGVYHTHQQPIALRYELGDHVDFNSSTKYYSESTNTVLHHSPIIGWAYDGYPIYGPYGYSVSNDANSGIRRMVSGYVLRTGENGTDNITNNLNVIPAWYARFRLAHFGGTYSITTTQARPSPSSAEYLGTFAEDYDYYGDITNPATSQLYVPGTNTFDLDEYNGRWCVTPEFPNGTYAYFLDIDTNGTSAYPYAIAYEYYGSAGGGSVTSISEAVTTNFYGGADSTLALKTPSVTNNNTVTLVWSSTEGGTYQVESSTDQNNWTVENTNVPATVGVSTTTNYLSSVTNGTVYVRVTRTALASYEDDGAGSGVIAQSAMQSYVVGLSLTLNPTNTFTEHGPYALVASNSTVADSSTDFTGGSLTVGGAGGFDQLFIASEGTGAGQIGVSGNAVSYGGVAFGNFSGGASGVALTINFTNSVATPAVVQELVDRIAFTNSYCNPSGNTRSITFALSDGNGNSASATNQLGFVTVNDPPTITHVNPLKGAVENTPFTISNVTITANSDMSDCENGYYGYIVVSVTSGTLTFDGTPVTPGSTTIWPPDALVWTPPANTFGTNLNAFVIEGFDGQLASTNSVQVSIAVAFTNQAPSVTLNPAGQSICAGDAISFSAAASGTPLPAAQWQVSTDAGVSFANLASQTNTTLTVTTSLADNGNQYRAVFTNSNGSATTTAATLTVNALPDATITAATNAIAGSTTNVAGAAAGAASYAWAVTNGSIIAGANAQTMTYAAGSSGEVGITLVVAGTNACAASSSVNVPISAGPSLTNYSSGDVVLTSWMTNTAGQYARVYTNDTMKNAGTSLTTWSNGSQFQTNPVYAGVQEIYSSTNWVYVRASGLAGYTMGPWYLDAQHLQLFPNLPANQRELYRIPRTTSVPSSKTATGSGLIGVAADGVALYNSWDAYYWNGTNDVQSSGGTGYWNRDAYVNESVSFDPAHAHQAGDQYHYHADPLGLRYLLGDHVDFDSATKIYSESTNTPTKHSPIIGWMADGYPLYGPYGYSAAGDTNSGIRRMVSGYVLRNSQNGTDNLSTNGAPRATIPAWAQRLFNASANQAGPTVSTQYPLGRYMEDNAYLGDLTNPATSQRYQQGVDYDLDEYNGRWCVTPEFPHGIYAYFVAISSNGVPAFPYDIGRGYYGNPTGGSVAAITESVATNFLGNTNLTSTLNAPGLNNGMVTLTWSAIEGGSYQVEATTNLSDSSAWTVIASGLSPDKTVGASTNRAAGDQEFYRTVRTGVATFDSTGATIVAVPASAPGGSASRGQTVYLTITLPSSPPNPPAGAPITSVTVGSISCSDISYTTQGTVQAICVIPSGYTPTGAQDVVVTFQSPAPAYTLAGGFTIN